jgi:hypothetical protein
LASGEAIFFNLLAIKQLGLFEFVYTTY